MLEMTNRARNVREYRLRNGRSHKSGFGVGHFLVSSCCELLDIGRPEAVVRGEYPYLVMPSTYLKKCGASSNNHCGLISITCL